MAGTYTPIISTTVTEFTYYAEFTSIPQTYTDLYLVVNGLSDGNSSFYVYLLNNDSSSIYSWTRLRSTSNVTTNRAINTDFAYLGEVATNAAPNTWFFPSYSNTNINKLIVSQSGRPGTVTHLYGFAYPSTAALTSFDLQGSFNPGTTFTLYGIKAA